MIFLYVIITIIILYCAAASVLIIKGAGEKREIPKGTPAIVLGCTVRNDKMSKMLIRRCDRALEYMNGDKNAVVILSGGREDEINRAEAQAMFEYLTENGADSARLIIENKSETTQENMLFSKEILDKLGLGSEAVIITTDFHQFRSKIYAERAGIVPYSLSSRLTAGAFLKNIVREWIVILGLLKK